MSKKVLIVTDSACDLPQSYLDENNIKLISFHINLKEKTFLDRIDLTTKEMFKKIDQTANAFSKYGIKEGDFVTICAAGIPETVYSFYALSKIGAVANMISPWFDHNQLVERIEDCKSDMLIIMDKFYPLVKDAIDKSRINKVVIIPTLNSSALKQA